MICEQGKLQEAVVIDGKAEVRGRQRDGRSEAVWVVNLRGLCRTFLHQRRDKCDLLPSLNLALNKDWQEYSILRSQKPIEIGRRGK